MIGQTRSESMVRNSKLIYFVATFWNGKPYLFKFWIFLNVKISFWKQSINVFNEESKFTSNILIEHPTDLDAKERNCWIGRKDAKVVSDRNIKVFNSKI